MEGVGVDPGVSAEGDALRNPFKAPAAEVTSVSEEPPSNPGLPGPDSSL